MPEIGAGILFAAKGKNLYHEEGYRYAQHCCQQIAEYWWEVKHIVEDNYDDILNNVVRDIGNEKLYISVQAESFMENNPAVHPVGDDVAYDIANIKV